MNFYYLYMNGVQMTFFCSSSCIRINYDISLFFSVHLYIYKYYEFLLYTFYFAFCYKRCK